jgi:hypothetical protein
MPREWTSEQKQAAGDRMKAGRLARLQPDGKPADPNPVSRLSKEMKFMSQVRNTAPIETKEDVYAIEGNVKESPEDEGHVTHRTPGLVYMYRKEHWGWKRVKVAMNSAADLLRAGFLPECGDCGGDHDEGINSCPAREPLMYRTCPVPTCHKKIYDIEDQTGADITGAEDPAAIQDEAYKLATPELRTKARLDSHIRTYHETYAITLGLWNGAGTNQGAPVPAGAR